MIFIVGIAIVPMVTCLGHMTNASYLKLVIVAFAYLVNYTSERRRKLFSIIAMVLASKCYLGMIYDQGV